MFSTKNKVRMNDTDMAGLLFFANQFRFVHDALEDFIESENLSIEKILIKENFLFVIVHAESDYLEQLKIGDALKVDLEVEHIGNSSFTLKYHIYKNNDLLVGTAKTVHVTINNLTRKKMPIPPKIKLLLEKHLNKD